MRRVLPLDARPDGAHVSRDAIEKTLDALASDGVFTVAFGGGEPLLRDDLESSPRARVRAEFFPSSRRAASA